MRSSLRGSCLRAAIDPIIQVLAEMERLEPRQLLNAINGSGGDDVFQIEYQNNAIHSILKNNQPVSFLEPVTINGLDGDDQLVIEYNSDRAAIFNFDRSTAGSGNITQRNRQLLSFTSIESHNASELVKFTIVAPNSVDAFSVQKFSETDISVTGTSDSLALPSFTLSSIPKVVLNTGVNDSVGGGSGDDTITIGAAGASGTMNTRVFVNSGVGDNTLDVLGGLTTTVNTSFGISGVYLTVNVNNSSIVNFLTTQLLQSLNLNDNSKVILSAHHYHVLGTNNLSMSANAILDMTDNDMVVHSAPGTTNAVNLAYITGLLDSGYGDGTFNGHGIISSLSSADVVLLGVTPAANQPEPADILIKYTYGGDTNLDRQVTISDFIDVASNFNGVGGWGAGDFNYDGVVTQADFFTTSANLNQVHPLSPTVSGPAAWGLDYTLDLSANTTTTPVLGWAIDWGDGDFEAFDGNPATATHSYDEAGAYTIQASARSTNLSYFAPAKAVTIIDDPLFAYIVSGPASGSEGVAVSYQSRILNLTGAAANYSWVARRGGTTVATSSSADLTFTPPEDGAYTIDLTVSAAGHDPVSAPQRTLSVANVAPTLWLSGPPVVDEGSPYRLNLSWSDPGNDKLAKWVIHWGDGASTTLRRKPSWAARSVVAKHTYADGADSHTIWATASDEDGSYSIQASMDGSFGSDGMVSSHLGNSHAVKPSMALSDGKVLVAIDKANFTTDFAIQRFDAVGHLDTSFGTGGTALVDFGGQDFPTGIAVLADGRIMVGGYSQDLSSGQRRFAVARLSASGANEASAMADFGDELNYSANAIVVQPAGDEEKIVLGGYGTDPEDSSTTLFALTRFDSDLNLDTTFGDSGKVAIGFGSNAKINALAIQNVEDEARIVAAGYSGTPNTIISLARLLPDGALDDDFGSGGVLTTLLGTRSMANAVAISRDGKIVVAGKKDNDFAIVRYTASGDLDQGFNTGETPGKVAIDFSGGVDIANGVAIDQKNRIVAVGSALNGTNDVAVVRLKENGDLDTSLGANGKIATSLSPGSDVAGSVAVRPNGRFIVAGTRTPSTGVLDVALVSYPLVVVQDVAPALELSLSAPTEGGSIQATVTESDPGNDTISAWSIDWGDGSAAQIFNQAPVNVVHNFAGPGTRDITVTVMDEDGPHSAVFSRNISMVPSGPTDLVTAAGPSDIWLQWTDHSNWETGFEIQANIAGNTFTTIATVAADTTHFVAQGFNATTSFRVRATSDAGKSTFSNVQGDSAIDTTPPDMSGTQAEVRTDHSIELRWSASTSDTVGYEISRNGEPIATVSGTSYTDVNLEANTAYQYSVRAFDLAGNYSDPATYSASTRDVDSDPPAAPQLELHTSQQYGDSWITMNSEGAAGYEIYRNGLRIATTENSSYEVEKGFSYTVYAFDAAGNYSDGADITTPAAEPNDDDVYLNESPNQYIQPTYQHYFYDELTKGLRQRFILLGRGDAPPARHWFDLGDHYFLKSGGVLEPDGVSFEDKNGNRRWEPGEGAWKESGSGDSSHFSSGDQTVYGSPASGAKGVGGNIWYKDRPNQGTLHSKDSSEPYFFYDIELIQGDSAALAYRDYSGDGVWSDEEPIWEDSNRNSIYDEGEQVLNHPDAAHTPHEGDWGKTHGLEYFADEDDGLVWSDRRIDDQPTFQQDLEAVYPALESIIPNFQMGTDCGCVTYWTKGAILEQIGKSRAGTGTASLPEPGGTVLITGAPNFAEELQLKSRAAIKLGANWYNISSVGQNSVNVSSEVHDFSGGSYRVAEWTRVPNRDGYFYEAGPYHADDRGVYGLVFSEHLEELSQVMNLLRVVPRATDGSRVYTPAESDRFLALAQDAMDVHASIFGEGNDDDLAALVNSGQISAGAPQEWRHFSALQWLVFHIAENVVKRENGVFVVGDDDLLEVIGHEGEEPAQWWDPVECDDDPWESFEDTKNLLNRIQQNGLWISPDNRGKTRGLAEVKDKEGRAAVEFQRTDHGTPASNDWEEWSPPNGFCEYGASEGWDYYGIGSMSDQIWENKDYLNPENSDRLFRTGGAIFCEWHYVVQTPANTNPLGGNRAGSFGYNTSDNSSVPAIGFSMHYDRWDYPISGTRSQLPWPQFPSAPCNDWKVSPDDGFSNLITGVNNSKTAIVTHHCTFEGSQLVSEWFSRIAFVDVRHYERPWYVYWTLLIPKTSHPLSRPHPNEAAAPPQPPSESDAPATTVTDVLGGFGEGTPQRLVSPDTNADDIVEVDGDFTSFGNDTGFMYLQPNRGGLQTVLPIYTDSFGALPIHAYLSSGYPAPNTYWTGTDVDEDGIPYAYSLDTRARVDVLLNTRRNHRKEIEIIRPRGNSVVFEFTYSGNGHFSDIGLPKSYGGREEKRLYLLRDLTPNDDDDFKYMLMFPSGVSHVFGGNGELIKVIRNDGSSVAVASPSAEISVDFEKLRGMPPEDDDPMAISPRYNVDVVWKDGQIHDVRYTTRDESKVINTELDRRPSGLRFIKTSGSPGSLSDMEGFSYYSSNAGFLVGGRSVTCVGACEPGAMKIRTTVQGIDGYQEVTTELNDAKLIQKQTVHLVTDSTDETSSVSYQYKSGTRYNNGVAPWGLVGRITTQLNGSADDSWQQFEYDGLGRLSQIMTPLNGTQNRVQRYIYDSADSGHGQPAEPAALVERPRLITSLAGGIEIGREYRRYSAAIGSGESTYPGPITVRQTRLPGATWEGPEGNNSALVANLETIITAHPFGPADVISSTGGARYGTTRETDDDGNLTRVRVVVETLGTGGVVLQSTDSLFDAFGTTLESETRDSESNLPIAKFSAEVDSFGRLEKLHDQIGGRDAKFDDYTWDGPRLLTDFDGVQISIVYSAAGQVLSEEMLGVRTEYQRDAAGNVVNETRTSTSGGSSLSISSSARFDAVGRAILLTDEEGKETRIAYTTSGDHSTMTVTYPGDATYIETYNLDGSLRSIGGTATYPVEFDSGIDEEFTGQDGPYGFWTSVTQKSASGADITTKTWFNALGQAYYAERPADNGVATSIRRYDKFARPVQEKGFDGVWTALKYDRDQVVDVILDANANGHLDSGERHRSYASEFTNRDGTPVFQSVTHINGTPDSEYISQQSLDGMESWENDNGLESHSLLRLLSAPGSSRLTIDNPDGTSSELEYKNRVLASQKDLGVNGQTIHSERFANDDLLRGKSASDVFGTTLVERLKNGLINKSTFADGSSVEVLDRDERTYVPTHIRRPDGKETYRAVDDRGQIFSQWGAGVVPAGFDHSNFSGDLTDLTTFGAQTADTSWQYSDATGFLSGKKYAGSTSADIEYLYNNTLQLEQVNRPGSDLSISYDAGTGDWTDRSYNNGQLSYHVSVNDRDMMGRIKALTQTVSGSSSTTYFDYTALDQLQRETLSQLGGSFNTYYDYFGTDETAGAASPGAAKSVAVRNGTSDVVKESYGYDEGAKRLHSITTATGTFTYDYLPGTDLVQSVSGPGGMVTTRRYEPQTGRLRSISVSSGNQLRYAVSYEYNDNDQRIGADILLVLSDGSTKSEHWEYDYDEQDQLVFAAVYDESGETTQEFDYEFDEVGNDLAFEPNALNQYTVDPLTDNEITYDERGNLTYDGAFHYSYNAQDRVIEARDQQNRATYGYDAQGRQIWRKSYQWDANLSNGAGDWSLQRTLTFAYDGWRLMAEFELQSNGSQHLIRSYAWGLDVSGTVEGAGGIGGLLSVTVYAANGTPTTYQVVHDGNGNVVQLIDAAGAVAATYEYGPFGNLLSAQGPGADACPMGLSDKRRDELTGDSQFGLREFNPRLRRWNERDPIEENGGLNLYAYVGNDPINAVDPVGLDQDGIIDINISGRDTLVVELPTGRQQWEWDTRALPRDNGDVSEWTCVNGSRCWYSVDRRKFEKLVVDETPLPYWSGGVVPLKWVETSREDAAAINSVAPEKIRVSGSYSIYWNVRWRYLDEAVANWAKTLTEFRREVHKQVEDNKNFTRNLFLAEATAAIVVGVWSTLRASGDPGLGGPRSLNRDLRDGNQSLKAGEAGRFGDLEKKAIVGDNLTPHHMPQTAQNFTSRADGGAIVIRQSEHISTRTYGISGARVAAQEAGLPFRTVLGRDLRDLRRLVGQKYDEGISKLLEYYREQFPNFMNKTGD